MDTPEYSRALAAFAAAGKELDRMFSSGTIDMGIINDAVAASDRMTEARINGHRIHAA